MQTHSSVSVNMSVVSKFIVFYCYVIMKQFSSFVIFLDSMLRDKLLGVPHKKII